MPVKPDAFGWIDKAERMPTKADCDAQECILVWYEGNGANVVTLDTMEHYGTFISHWMPLPERPQSLGG